MKYPILVIIPSLNRPKSVPACIESFTTHGTGLADYLVVERRTEPGMQAALNSVAQARELLQQYEIVGIINDDVRMRTPGWDRLVQGKLQGKTGMVYGRDGIQDQRLSTQPFFSAHVALDIGLLGPPAPFRNLNDVFWWEIFHALGRVEYLPELFTEHLHVSANLSPMDETYRANFDTFHQDNARWPEFRSRALPQLVAKIKVRPTFYSEHGEDRWLFDHHLLPMAGTYVDIGAAWPKQFSNTALLRDLGWSGIQVDGCPDYRPLWAEQGLELIVQVIGCGAEAGYVINRDQPGLSRIQEGSPAVPALTLNQLLDQRGLGKIDLLSVDVEGSEFALLSTLDFDRHRPAIIIWEYNTLGVKNEHLRPFLDALGYECVHRTECNYIHLDRAAVRPT